jgi:hypothetical protein
MMCLRAYQRHPSVIQGTFFGLSISSLSPFDTGLCASLANYWPQRKPQVAKKISKYKYVRYKKQLFVVVAQQLGCGTP